LSILFPILVNLLFKLFVEKASYVKYSSFRTDTTLPPGLLRGLEYFGTQLEKTSTFNTARYDVKKLR
jgi:hypothetical protein